MSLNTAHTNNGVLIYAGEAILLFSDNVQMEFSGQNNQVFNGTKTGRIYLTTHRMIFNAKKSDEPMQSFSSPFICMTDVEVEQPVFGANYIRGKVRAQENGNFVGEIKFKLVFKSGGALEFAQAMLRAAHIAKQNNNGPPPPYTPPNGAWYEAPPPAYSPNPSGYYGWIPNTAAFPNSPATNGVYMVDEPPPYPGIVPQGQQTANGYPGAPPSYGNQGGMYPQVPSGGYGAPPSYPQHQPQGYPPQPQGYPPQPQGYAPQPQGYPSQPQGYPPQSQGYPLQQQGLQGTAAPAYPSWGNPNYNQGAGGYGAPGNSSGYAPPPNSKEAEAAASGNYNNQPQPPNPPPPGYNEPPPSYNSLNQQARQQ